MNRDQENFEQVRRLLVLKRYEVPPPGYFDNFSREVMIRIRSGERTELSIFERLSWEAPWLHRFWSAFESKPALAGVFGLAVCGLLVSAVVYSENSDAAAVPAFGQAQPAPQKLQLVDNSGLVAPVLPASAAATPLGNGMGAVVPVGYNPGSLFQGPQGQGQTERANFLVPQKR